jgi:hypothetical protein
MAKTKLKVNAKAFVEDFRKGLSEDQLMLTHGLDQRTLTRVFRLLIEKRLLEPSELRETSPLPPLEEGEDYTLAAPEPYYRMPEPPAAAAAEQDSVEGSSRCPQCRAMVSNRMLTCPECGHVLPGEERWTNPEKEKGLLARIPAKVLGYGIALLGGLALFLVFQRIILPMTTVTMDRSHPVKKDVSKKPGPLQPPEDAEQEPEKPIDGLVEQLSRDGILASVSEDYFTMTTGDRWTTLSREEQIHYLTQIWLAMRRSGITIEFEVMNPFGQSVAKGSAASLLYSDPDTGAQLRISPGGRAEPVSSSGPPPPRAPSAKPGPPK